MLKKIGSGSLGLLAVIAALMLLASCGGDDDDGAPDPEVTPAETADKKPADEEPARPASQQRKKKQDEKQQAKKEREPEGKEKFTGVHRNNYEVAETVCGAFPRGKVASDLGLSPNSDPVDIAEAYAEGYRAAFQQANFEGCLEGLR